jgi:RNA polymerase sigma-70 factor, ECF subfamily
LLPEIEVSMNASATIRVSPLPAAKPATETEEEIPILATSDTSTSQQIKTPDEVLMAQLGRGNREALGILFRRYARVIRSIAYRAVRDAAEADDLVQDIFLLVHRNSKAFDLAKGSARSWILQIAHRRAISRHRYLSSRHFYNRVELDNLTAELEDPHPVAGQAGDSIDEMFGEASFQKIFEQLSRNQRETLRLHFFEGYSLAEIAAKLGQSPGNVKHHYFRGIERLRKELFSGKLQSNRTVW